MGTEEEKLITFNTENSRKQQVDMLYTAYVREDEYLYTLQYTWIHNIVL